MSNFSDLFGSAGMKPKRITQLTSGTGTFTPLLVGGLIRLTVQAAGGGGFLTASSSPSVAPGGGGGAAFQDMVRFYGAVVYALGVAGAASGNASPTRIAGIFVEGGQGATSTNNPGRGGFPPVVRFDMLSTTASGVIVPSGYYLGGRGGGVDSGYSGSGIGMPQLAPSTSIGYQYQQTGSTAIGAPNYSSSQQGAGGDSLLGQGARGSITTTAIVTAGVGYGWGGAGGGANTTLNAGGPPIIIIEEFGI